MKRIYLMVALVAVLASGCKFGGHADSQSISIRNTNEGYNFQASYPERKSKYVVDYVERTLKDDRIFDAAEKKDAEIVLGDGSRFYLKAYPGYVEIDFKKNKNSFTSYQKLKELCAGVKDTLK
ncbi:hypothetical protein [Pedobacter sp. ASV12]|uniref:hypothetical protein n=1 Tax=Pedobacter sp. ASV12 TaxID=2795120 RepID=UPI0018EC0B53|nr:hypothetical protein [Pedobacter sp. ASV12]